MVTENIAQQANISLKAGDFFPSKIFFIYIYANIIYISVKVKLLFRENEKHDLETFVQIETFWEKCGAKIILWHLRQY